MAMEKVTTSVHKYFILLLLQNWTENRAKDYSVLQNSNFDGSNATGKKKGKEKKKKKPSGEV